MCLLSMGQLLGYGQTGPDTKSPGYDVVIEAEAGLMHIYVLQYQHVSLN